MRQYVKSDPRQVMNTDIPFPGMPFEWYFDEKIEDWGISRLSKGIINISNPEEIIRVRRRHYQALNEAVQDSRSGGVRSLFEGLPEKVCPLLMAVVVTDPLSWVRELRKLNVFAIRWWSGYHRNFSWHGFPEACDLKNRLLAFRINQHLEDGQIEYVADCIREVSLKLR